MTLNLHTILSSFHTGVITKAEFESILYDVVQEQLLGVQIQQITYHDAGVTIITPEETIELQIDWNELKVE